MSESSKPEILWAALPNRYLYAFDQTKFGVALLVVLHVFYTAYAFSKHAHHAQEHLLLSTSLVAGAILCIIQVAVVISQFYIYIGHARGIFFCPCKRRDRIFEIGAPFGEFQYDRLGRYECMSLWRGIGVMSLSAENQNRLFNTTKGQDVSDQAEGIRGQRIELDSASTFIKAGYVCAPQATFDDGDNVALFDKLLQLIFMAPATSPGGFLNKHIYLNLFCTDEILKMVMSNIRSARGFEEENIAL